MTADLTHAVIDQAVGVSRTVKELPLSIGVLAAGGFTVRAIRAWCESAFTDVEAQDLEVELLRFQQGEGVLAKDIEAALARVDAAARDQWMKEA